MFLFGKSKKLEERIAQLEQELNDTRTNAEQELQAEHEKYAELETQVESLNAAREALEAEKARYEEAIADLRQQNEAALDEERSRSNDALIALREHIYAERADLMNQSEKELSVQTLMGLSGFGTRMERLERRYADLLKAVNTEVSTVISTESENILGGFQDAKAEMIDAFSAQGEAMRSDYGKVNEEALQALSSDTQAVVRSFHENTAQMLEELTQKSELMRSDYGRINEESMQTLSASTQAVVTSFQEKTTQMLEELTQESSTMRSEYGKINDEAMQALSANSQAVVNSFRQNTTQMAEMVDSLRREIGQAAKNTVEAVTAVPNPFEDSALSARMNGIEQAIMSLKERIEGLERCDIREGLSSILDRIEALGDKVNELSASWSSSDIIEKSAEEVKLEDMSEAAEELTGNEAPVDSEEPAEND